jgi:hypothetical protein
MGKPNNIILFISFAIIQIILGSLIDLGPLLFISVYPLFLITRPANKSIHSTLLWAFAMGMAVDYFTNSILGINSAAALIMALFQNRILKIVCSKGDWDNQVRPGMRELGAGRFLSYLVPALLVHHLAFSLIESFGVVSFIYNLPRVFISLIANTLLILLIEYGLFYKNWR